MYNSISDDGDIKQSKSIDLDFGKNINILDFVVVGPKFVCLLIENQVLKLVGEGVAPYMVSTVLRRGIGFEKLTPINQTSFHVNSYYGDISADFEIKDNKFVKLIQYKDYDLDFFTKSGLHVEEGGKIYRNDRLLHECNYDLTGCRIKRTLSSHLLAYGDDNWVKVFDEKSCNFRNLVHTLPQGSFILLYEPSTRTVVTESSILTVSIWDERFNRLPVYIRYNEDWIREIFGNYIYSLNRIGSKLVNYKTNQSMSTPMEHRVVSLMTEEFVEYRVHNWKKVSKSLYLVK